MKIKKMETANSQNSAFGCLNARATALRSQKNLHFAYTQTDR
jgi:hypothetical protein